MAYHKGAGGGGKLEDGTPRMGYKFGKCFGKTGINTKVNRPTTATGRNQAKDTDDMAHGAHKSRKKLSP